MTQTLRMLWQMGILVAVYWASEGVVRLTGLPIPGSVLGIVVLFTLLMTGIVKESHINDASTFFLRHLLFFFIPIASGLMDWGDVFYDYGWVLLGALLFSAIVPMITMAFLAKALLKGGDTCSTS